MKIVAVGLAFGAAAICFLSYFMAKDFGAIICASIFLTGGLIILSDIK